MLGLFVLTNFDKNLKNRIFFAQNQINNLFYILCAYDKIYLLEKNKI